MPDIKHALTKASQRYLDLVAQNFTKHDVTVTGATLESFHAVQKPGNSGFQILAAEHAPTVEYGRGPTQKASGGGQVVRRIMEWLKAKGSDANPYAVSKTIHIKGTRLWRGEDPRYPGKFQSGILTEPVGIMKQELVIDLKSILSSQLELKIKALFQ